MKEEKGGIWLITRWHSCHFCAVTTLCTALTIFALFSSTSCRKRRNGAADWRRLNRREMSAHNASLYFAGSDRSRSAQASITLSICRLTAISSTGTSTSLFRASIRKAAHRSLRPLISSCFCGCSCCCCCAREREREREREKTSVRVVDSVSGDNQSDYSKGGGVN